MDYSVSIAWKDRKDISEMLLCFSGKMKIKKERREDRIVCFSEMENVKFKSFHMYPLTFSNKDQHLHFWLLLQNFVKVVSKRVSSLSNLAIAIIIICCLKSNRVLLCTNN